MSLAPVASAAASSLTQLWLSERQKLIVTFHHLCSHRPFEKSPATDIVLIANALAEFCQLLVDYVSLGHFKVFEKIISRAEISQEANHRAQQVLQAIFHTTVAALHFNDKYQLIDTLEHLEADLSAFTEKFAHRLAWEDELIDIYSNI